MANERTYVMCKPGVLQRRVIGEILSRFERKGLKIVAMKLMRIAPEIAEQHYGEHKGKGFYDELLSYTTSAPVLAMVLEGDGAIAIVRRLLGPTSVNDSQPGTIRGDYAMHTGLNLVHASDSAPSAEREIGLFFKPEELIEWKDGNEQWF